jgi:acyl-[acyl-carrier-protein]-phospholipid O-acyltransferase/long-chain-fatty-acid--[acyl-carrier-protein] ligase
MIGYLNRQDLTDAACPGDWYVTGDVARVDEDGFIFITDRLFRFSKIAGEMVPHIAAEEVLLRGIGAVELSVAVTAVADQRKGERLAVLYTEQAGSAERLCEILGTSELPNLWRPTASMFFKVANLPVTATGKLDVRAVKTLADELAQRRENA